MTKSKQIKTGATLDTSRVYQICIRGSGGEFAVEGISKIASDYWSQKDQAELLLYVLDPEDDDFIEMDDRIRMPQWHEGDLLHEYGFTEIDKIIVSANDDEEIGRISDEVEDLTFSMDHMNQLKLDDPTLPKVYTQSREDGSIVYEVRLTDEFNFDKLSFQQYHFCGISLIAEVLYDGVLLDFEDERFDRHNGFFARIVS